ncbi:glycerol-3-phosphate responsive antiterminator [Anaeroselena agilis]|uniref:Glycerol-3-phosphate responsive antiterminator n=1 Tax=Anaeroselena agilis TaxID=3063788 RepID=A0ABU3NZC5_9FIRM|nr:glycerol-3-phosphate responsive antiterminator [Selenomonadales bacterium 4137-cl]
MADIIAKLCPGPVVPAARTPADLTHALAHTSAPAVILLFGDINTLPGLLAEAKRHGKRLIVHLDLLDGVGKDRAGVKCLARLGVAALITTKQQLVKTARDEGMIVVQRLFIMDTEALRTAVKVVNHAKPDAVEILPASVPGWVFTEITRQTGLPLLAGGLAATRADIDSALAGGAAAVSTSNRDLWQ